MIFNIFRKRTVKREPFETFLMNSSIRNPSESLESALDAYIKKYSLRVSHSLEEPALITDKRTKLKVLEESAFSDSANCDAPEVAAYIHSLRAMVVMFDTLSPEALDAMKRKEQNS